MLPLLLLGHAPVAVAAALWLALVVAIVLLLRAIRRQDARERAARRTRLDRHAHRLAEHAHHLAEHVDWLAEHETRLRAIEEHLFITPPRPQEYP